MARPVLRRGDKKYLGIDFAAEDFAELQRIADEDGERGVSSLVRSIVRAWLRARENSGQGSLPAVMTIPSPTSRQFNLANLHPVVVDPPPSAGGWAPSNPHFEEAPKPSGDKDEEEPR